MKNVCKYLSLIFCIVLLITITGCKKKYTVTFKDYDGTVLKEDVVNKGESASAPIVPSRDGYNFVGWDKNFSNVSENLIIIATYEKVEEKEDEEENVNEYTITFEPKLVDDLKSITVVYNNEYEDSYWENLEENGFVSYDILKKQSDAEYETEKNKTQIILMGNNYVIHPDKYQLPYDEGATDIEKIISARFEDDLEYIYKLVSESTGFTSTPELEEAYTLMKEKLDRVTRNDYLNNLRNKLILSNDKYDLYFNFTTTQFVLKEKDENGKVINSWSSTPENSDINNKSVFTIACVEDNEDAPETPIEYDSYSNSCLENIDKAISPSFSVNVVKDSNGNAEKIIVYYTLEQKGIDATYIPNKISLPRMRELIERCNKLVAEYKEENNGEYPVDSSGLKITELGFLSEILGTNPATGEPFEFSTIEFYSAVVDTYYKRMEVNTNFEELPLEEQYYELKITSDTAIGQCYRFFYEWCGYTVDELVIDTGVEKQIPTTPIINVAIEYKLGENGLEIMVPSNSVKTNQNDNGKYYRVTLINLLPYIVVLE